ncbi:MAG: beta-phosphoglucomutase [Oscillospiraceae bacterium]|nr:beta-phosphoglucomutase [Oscillospiraceae bacterium]
MIQKKLEAVIFDLDGVITDSAEFHFMAWKKLADKLGIYFDREINERLKGVPRMDSLNIILERDSIPDRYSQEEKEALANEKNDDYVDLIKTITPNDLLPGISNLLHDLQNRKIKTAIASASKNASMIVERLQAGHLFDFVADAGAIKNQKPAPDVFLVSAENISVPPENCVGVEDAAAGIIAIKAAGMVAVGIGDKNILKGADLVLPDTAALTYEVIQEVFG